MTLAENPNSIKKKIISHGVRTIEIAEKNQSQRLDNFLKTFLKKVPKSYIYRIVRTGQIRINKKRAKPDYRLQTGDVIRIPPLYLAPESTPNIKPSNISHLENAILFEDDEVIVLNKPAGMAVHGGSGLSYGVIEAMRTLRPKNKDLELVHRLDRETSGCLILAKKRTTLKGLHEQFRKTVESGKWKVRSEVWSGKRKDWIASGVTHPRNDEVITHVQKTYLMLVKGQWQAKNELVDIPLNKNQLQSGERMVFADPLGKVAKTRFNTIQVFSDATLLEAMPFTGRTHQLRVHALAKGHPILGDDKYGDKLANNRAKANGLSRLFLHAKSLAFTLPMKEKSLTVTSPLPLNLKKVLEALCHSREHGNDRQPEKT